jgi:choice-of-anchor A domain-containing protein
MSIRNRFAVSIAVLLACVAVADRAGATAISAQTALQDFNAIIYTNAVTQSDVEGATVVGGNFQGATLNNNPTYSGLPSGFGALTVYGSTSGNAINLNNGGNAYVGGTSGATVNFNGNGHFTYTAPPSSITDFETSLNALSTSLSQLSSTSTLPATGNNEVLTAIPGANGVAVFNITAAQLAAIPSFTINTNGASSVIFNVSGTSATFSANDESGVTGANSIIWNFYQATSVSLQTQIGGTILATGASVTNSNQIDGVLVANSFTGNGEIHDYQFTGTLPGGTQTGGNQQTPEPASLLTFAVGLLALGFLRRQVTKRA